ncbi:hypothetical protein ACJIZ3_023077 [Penstemon smallii]|uniref:Uncharacterized protein n=1 Tax=Penstemon smallii TaxID=265156 RepID=A0ABD3TPF2_9LAMI
MDTDYYYCRKSGQIPAFGDWDNANEMPITQYFECARQAGLLRCSCSGEQCGGDNSNYINNNNNNYWGAGGGGGAAVGNVDLYGVANFEQKRPLPRRRVNNYDAPQRKTRGKNTKEQMKQVKVRDLVDQPKTRPVSQKGQYTNHHRNKSSNFTSQKSLTTVKPVDEDLYKIPSELIEKSKRKKMLGFFSRCMVPPCAA